MWVVEWPPYEKVQDGGSPPRMWPTKRLAKKLRISMMDGKSTYAKTAPSIPNDRNCTSNIDQLSKAVREYASRGAPNHAQPFLERAVRFLFPFVIDY
ncbi:hypothetical protein M5689_008197 [Euphorbia peplus]|nr:hypothetical protein M5689_008197 [Euphorbia peplus]